jgi:hypothetical protein
MNLLIPELVKSKAKQSCLFYTLEILKRSKFCLFHKFERLKRSELCLFHKLDRSKRSKSVYGFPQAFLVSKEASTAGWRYEKERHSVRLDVGKLHLVQGRICPLPLPPAHSPAVGKIRETSCVCPPLSPPSHPGTPHG